MNRAVITRLSLLVVLILCMEVNYAAARVFHEYSVSTEQSETDNPTDNNNLSDSALANAPAPNSAVVLLNEQPNVNNCFHRNTTVYTDDNIGYHVKYYYCLTSLEPLEPLNIQNRLNSNTLKAHAG